MEFLPAPPHASLHPGEVHVWRLDLDEGGGEVSHRGLREVLARYLRKPAGEIEVIRGERGKPRLAQEPLPLHFNLSHSKALALVAVCADREVGVDAEWIEPERQLVALAERALAPADAAAVREASATDRAAVFYERWTRHEARLKCLGLGLGAPPPQDPPPLSLETLAVDPRYAAAVAATGSQPLRLRCWTFDPPLPEAG